MADVSEKHMVQAEKVLDLILCPCAPGEDPREASIYVISHALANAEREGIDDERKRGRDWCAKRQEITRSAWKRDARSALAGDVRALRNRIDLIDAGPCEVVLSEAGDA